MIILIYISIIALLILFWGFWLNVFSKIVAIVLALPNIVIWAVKHRKTHGFLKSFNQYNYRDALETDVFLHYNLASFWNATMSKGGVPFGLIADDEKVETLSSRMGRKSIENSLTNFGWFLYYFLALVDKSTWKSGGHCIDAFNTYHQN